VKCKTCVYFNPDPNNSWFGWCQNKKNRIEPSLAFPNGTTPSKSQDHGCDDGKAKVKE